MTAVSYADIPPEIAKWLWENYIALEFVTLVAGDGGIGKGYLIADLAARITRGDLMPDGSRGPKAGSVLLITPEDDTRKTMAWRLRAARADIGKVYDLTGMVGNRFELPRDIHLLYEAVADIGDVRMVVIDPLAAVSSIGLTSGNAKLRKQLMEPLEKLAAEAKVAVVVNCHTVASGKIAGSVALVQAARLVLKVSRDRGDTRIRRIHLDKSNISDDEQPDVCYTLVKDQPAGYVAWLRDGELSPATPELGPAQQKIMDLLSDADGDPMGPVEISDTTGIACGVTRTELTKLKKKGLADNPQRGQWVAA